MQPATIIRSEIIRNIREFFYKEGFLEVDTPCLVKSPDPNPYNEVLEILSSSGEKLYLAPSPEFQLKKILSQGCKNIFQIGKAYRDMQENDLTHLKEFTILEWYRDNADYTDLMKDCENLVNFISMSFRLSEAHGGIPFPVENNDTRKGSLHSLRLGRDDGRLWPRISCKEAFEKYAKVNLDKFLDIETARTICEQKKYQITNKTTWEEMYHQIFLNEVEPKLKKEPAIILYDYPAPLAALSKLKDSNPLYAERFEFYLGGLEMGNGFSELTDPVEQEKRLKADIEERKRKGMKVFEYDHEFINALKKGIPKTAGIAVGIDRLVMFFTGSLDIHEVAPLHI